MNSPFLFQREMTFESPLSLEECIQRFHNFSKERNGGLLVILKNEKNCFDIESMYRNQEYVITSVEVSETFNGTNVKIDGSIPGVDQLMYWGIGIVMLLLVAVISLSDRNWMKFGWMCCALAVFYLVAVLIFNMGRKNAEDWIMKTILLS